MPTLDQIKTTVNNRLAILWPKVQAKQDAHFAAHGSYWQGLISHGTIPADGVESLPTIGAKAPTDQPDPWPAQWLNDSYPMAVKFDVYNGPLGRGYVATLYVMVVGRLFSRAVHGGDGQETWRTHAWKDITPP